MSFICKASLLIRGRQLIIQKDCFKKGFIVSLESRNKRQILQPLAQARFYSSENKNQLPINRERIYNGTLHKKIRFVKMFSLMTSAGSILCQPYRISKALEKVSSATVIGGTISTFGLFAFVTPIMLHLITKRYVVHLDYDRTKDTYIATTYSIFARKKQMEFTPNDVHLPTMTEMLTTCTIKGQPMFMDVRLFRDIAHYKRIMGFDKPMDFSLNAHEVKSVPRVEIVDEHGATAGDKFYKAGSTIELKCVVSKVPHPTGYVTWRHGSRMHNYDTTRGGIRYGHTNWQQVAMDRTTWKNLGEAYIQQWIQTG